jgi:DNA-binding transcriptional MerR regulator
MGQYSIKELEKLSGIKAHTIRIWEKRYRLIQPHRTATNIRFYSDEDLKKIINVSALSNQGLKISTIARFTPTELSQKVYDLSLTKNASDAQIDSLITYMLDLNEEQFRNHLKRLTESFGLEHTIIEIVYPFLSRIGVLWQTGTITPSHEHFISNLVRQWIIVAIDQLPIPRNNAFRALLFLPENELHEIGLLFAHYVVRKAGFQTFYLGQSVPYADLLAVGAQQKAQILVTHITSNPESNKVGDYLDRICSDFPSSWIWASGSTLQKISIRYPRNLKVFNDLAQLRKLLLDMGSLS